MALTEVADLLHKKIITKSGKELGHVFNVQFHHQKTKRSSFGTLTIAKLLYGRKGFLERLGIRQGKMKAIAWKQVRKITGNEIIVDIQ